MSDIVLETDSVYTSSEDTTQKQNHCHLLGSEGTLPCNLYSED